MSLIALNTDWRSVSVFGLAVATLVGVAAQDRYVPAAEITRDNVGRLEPAWTYRTGEAEPRFATRKPASFETTPIVVDGTMYLNTPLGRVIALDAASGRERWVFDPEIARDVTYGDFASRGVAAWVDTTVGAGFARADSGYSKRRRSRNCSHWMAATAAHVATLPAAVRLI
jgi:glucose dehydrogenase